jgi:hypothetical protein
MEGFSSLVGDPWGWWFSNFSVLPLTILEIRDPRSLGHTEPLAEGTDLKSGDEDSMSCQYLNIEAPSSSCCAWSELPTTSHLRCKSTVFFWPLWYSHLLSIFPIRWVLAGMNQLFYLFYAYIPYAATKRVPCCIGHAMGIVNMSSK